MRIKETSESGSRAAFSRARAPQKTRCYAKLSLGTPGKSALRAKHWLHQRPVGQHEHRDRPFDYQLNLCLVSGFREIEQKIIQQFGF